MVYTSDTSSTGFEPSKPSHNKSAKRKGDERELNRLTVRTPNRLTIPEDPVKPYSSSTVQVDARSDWPVMLEDPVQDRSVGEGTCPCFVRLRFTRVAGDSTSTILAAIAALFVPNAVGLELYHSALEVQLPEGSDCPRYVIEMQHYLSDPVDAQARGQILEGNLGTILGAITTSVSGPRYGIRRWRNGVVEDGDNPAIAHPGRLILSRDCDTARRLLDSVPSVLTNDYSADWTSNSVISWLLERAGLDAGAVTPPVGGATPSWQSGISRARQP